MSTPMVQQALSIGGATLILIAFIATTSGRMRLASPAYCVLNALGSIGIGLTVIDPLNIGALALQCVWTAYSLWLLARALRS